MPLSVSLNHNVPMAKAAQPTAAPIYVWNRTDEAVAAAAPADLRAVGISDVLARQVLVATSICHIRSFLPAAGLASIR